MSSPLVTVICVCYNQGRFVEEAISSVLAQSHRHIQLLVVDDGSTDDSVEIIEKCLNNLPSFQFFPLRENAGNCRAFNHALAHASGDYIVDLAADDILLEDRIADGVKALQLAGESYGVNFADAYLIDEQGRILDSHSRRFSHVSVPQGNVYRDLVERYFILSPTMMFRTKVIRDLGGYDETLSYEDFDFMIRSSRKYLYCYTARPLVKKRIVKGSMSQRQFRLFSPQLRSTFTVCQKILTLNRTSAEQKALSKRILHEMRVSLRLLQFHLFFKYVGLWIRNRRMHY